MFKRLLAVFIAAAAMLAWSATAFSQAAAFPNKPVRLVVPFPPGGAVDPIARVIANRLEQAWGQPVVVENKPGAATIIGADYVAKAPADGYTVILVATSFAVNPSAYSKLPFDPIKDFEPISLVSKLPLLLVVHPTLPVKSVKELIDYLKARPGKVNFSSIGLGSTQHLAGELFKTMAGVNVVHVPYKGSGPSMMSVSTGETSFTFESVFLQRSGKTRALAAAGAKRSPLLPDLPTMAESGLPGFDVASWVGLLAPAGTPPEIIQKWNRDVARIMQMPEVRQQQLNQGLEPIGSTSEHFRDFLKAEISRWGKVVQSAGIKLD